MGYDAWLEKPYQDACVASELWERVAEEHPDATDAELSVLVEEARQEAAEADAERYLDAYLDR